MTIIELLPCTRNFPGAWESGMAQPWPLVSVLSKPAQCEGQDSTRVTIHRTFQSTHQGLGSRGPKAGGHWRGQEATERPTQCSWNQSTSGRRLRWPPWDMSYHPPQTSREVLRAATGQTPRAGPVCSRSPRAAAFTALPERAGGRPGGRFQQPPGTLRLIAAKTSREPRTGCTSEKTVSGPCLIS